MATKKITIENPVSEGVEQPILTLFSQDWGGVNNTDAPITPYSEQGCDTPVPAGKEWGLNRGEIERFLKEQLVALKTTKVGSTRWSPSPNAANHYELWGFASAADQQEFMTEYVSASGIIEDMPQNVAALRIFTAELPIAATDTDSYTLSISASRTGTTAEPIVVKRGNDFNVALRVFAWHYPPSGGTGDAANFNVAPTIVVDRSTNGTTWERVGSATLTSIADGETDLTYPNVINVGQMADLGSDGNVMLRFSIPSYSYTNAAGETDTMTSNRVTVYLKTVTLGISMDTGDWISPYTVGDNATRLQTYFNLQGAVPKTLHVKFSNAAGVEYYNVETSNVTATGRYIYVISDDSNSAGVTESGVHTLTAWVSYGSGADEIVSDTIVHQLLVLKPSTAASVGKRVLIQQMAQTVDNFVQASICHYWVWNPILSGGSYINNTETEISVRFIVADGPNLAAEHEEYVVLPVSVKPGEDCELLATMEIETATSQDVYTARLHALDDEGNAMLTPPRQFSVDNTSGFQPVSGCVFHLNPKSRDNTETNPKTIINASKSESAVANPTSEWSNTFKMDSSDGYTQDDGGEKVLRIPAGRTLAVNYNPLDYLHTAPAPAKALTIDIDFQVNNIVNEDDPVLQLCEPTGSNGEYLGLRMLPMTGTMGSVTDHSEDTTDFRWAEGRRQHLCITITPSVYPNVNDDARYLDNYTSVQAHGSINLVRVYLNGVIEREMTYNSSNVEDGKGVEFCTTSALQLVFGQTGTNGRASGADIDIYGMRVWNSGLTPKQVLQNYVSSLPGSTEKRRVKAHNDITLDDNSGRISLPKACATGKNCLIWHGTEVMFGYGASGSERGWLEMRRYDYDGTYLPKYSGSFCKASKRLKGKGQGTTAMTYFYWNTQWKMGDVAYNDDPGYDRLVPSECLILTPSQIDSTIHLGTPTAMSGLSADDLKLFELVDAETYTHVCPVYGGNLGKDEPVGTGTKNYPCTVDSGGAVVTIMLPDGWINGNGDFYDVTTNPNGGQYCGPCWQPGPGLPFGSKHVLKINYASSMQSHLIGVNWLYNALHTAYCGTNSLQRDTPSAVVAKQVVPVMFFTAGKNVTSQDETDGAANFRGLGGFGPGKMDKPVWGYSKKASKITDQSDAHYRPDGHDYFAMFEGAVNNSILSDQIAPWDDTDHLDALGNVVQRAKVKYFFQDPLNPGVAKDPESFYYRSTDNNGNDSWEKGIGFDGGKTGRKSTDGLLYNSNSCDDPDNAPSAAITAILRNAWNYVYLHNPNIRYYNGTLEQLAAASLTEAERKRKWVTRDSWLLKRYDFCERTWVNAGLWNTESHAYDSINIFEAIGSPVGIQDDRQAVVDAYISHIVDEARPTNAGETNGIGAYFKAKSLRFHYVFENHFIAGTDNCSKNTYYVIDPVTHLIELHQDDVDTTLATDNFGFQSKPYYVDRMNPYDDKDTVRAENSSCYDGMLNTLFDLVEEMWAKRGTEAQKATLGNALGSVLLLMSELTGGIGSAESEVTSGVWRTLNRYLFDIQRYFPQVAYNETARIRYEFPAMLGYVGRDGEAPPLTQSMGDQLEAEIQFMKRRLIYMASYAGYGEFSHTIGGGGGSTGIADAVARLAVNSVALPNGGTPNQTFTVTPHQYLFPVFTWQSTTVATRHRTAPGTPFTYTTAFGFAETYPIAICGLNYYRSVGNLGDKTVNQTNFSIQGSRLTEFVAEPTTYYSTTQGGGSVTKEQYDALSAEAKAAYAPAFGRASNLQIDKTSDGATRLSRLSLNGCTTTGSTTQVPFDLSRLTLVEEIDLQGTVMQAVTVPQTSTLTSLLLPATLARLSLTAQPNLATLTIQGYESLTQFTVTGCPLLAAATRAHVESMQSANAGVTLVNISNIDWQAQPISGDTMRWLISVGNSGMCKLAGRITMAATTATPSGRLAYNDIDSLIRRYGNIYDNTIAVGGTGLYVNFAQTAVTASMMAIAGRKYINPTELTNQTIQSGSITGGYYDGLSLLINGAGNNPKAVQKADGTWTPDVKWSIQTAGMASYVKMKDLEPNKTYSYSPALQVLLVSQVTITIRATLTDINGNERYVEKIVGLWRRIPQVGDFAWTDGEFDNTDNTSKKLAGIVVMRQMFTQAGVLTTNVSECAYYKLWVFSYCGGTNANALNVTMNASTDGKSSSIGGVGTQCWGMYPSNDSNGISDTKNSDVYVNKMLAAIATATGRSDIFDTPLPNLQGTPPSITITKAIMQDDTKGDGWATINSTTYPYLTNFDSESERDTLLTYADTVLQAVLDYFGISDSDLPADCKAADGHTRPMTPQALADLTQLVVMYCIRDMLCTEFSTSSTYAVGAHVIHNGGRYTCIEAVDTVGEWNGSKWESFDITDIDLSSSEVTALSPGRFRELMFPAQRLAFTWCPADVTVNNIQENDLDEQYRRGKWMLPSSGLLARIFNFYGNSRAGYNTSEAAAATYADENALEAMLPIFANAMARSANRVIPVTYSSYHWSSTENSRSYARGVGFGSGYAYSLNYSKSGSYVVRPVSAFTFVP